MSRTINHSEWVTPIIPEINEWHSLGPVTDYQIENDALVIVCGRAKLFIVPNCEGIIRIRLAQNGDFVRDHSWSVLETKDQPASWRFEEDDEFLYLITDHIRVCIQRYPCRLSFFNSDGDLIAGEDPGKGISWHGEDVRSWMQLDKEDHFFGLGERGCPLDKRGTVLVNWNRDAAEHEPWSDPLYQSHPFVVVMNQSRAYGLFFDNAYRVSFDLGKTMAGAFSFGADGGEMNYYFILGPTPRHVLQRYAMLVGTPPLPPRWSLGYQQCRFSYESAGRVRNIAKLLRAHRIPCDTIYLDIDYMDDFRCFTWNRKRFPRPDRLMKKLAARGFKTVVIIDPGIKVETGYPMYDEGLAGDHFCRDGDDQNYVGRVWPGNTTFPDFTRPATRRWWGSLYKGLIGDGVTGFWNDMNEPADFSQTNGTVPLTIKHDNEGLPADHRAVHNIYGMQMARATFEGLQKLRSNERPFVLTRAGFSGVQRYAAVWTGDNLSSWDHLRMSIPMLLNMSLSGIAFCGADIGGFRGVPSAELYTRWLQLGLFYPLCRTHTVGGPEQDPTAYGQRYEVINRRAIELRYRLIPYLYTLFHEAATTGLPPLRPVLLEFPQHPDAHRCEHVFMFGSQLFVAPVVHEGVKTHNVRLPAGDWYDFHDARPRTGGKAFKLPVNLSSIPMFARSGAIIPMRHLVQFVDEKPMDELILNIFPGNGTGSFYHDDGISYDHSSGAFALEEYAIEKRHAITTFHLTKRSGSDDFAPISYYLKFRGIKKLPRSVTAGGEAIAQKMKKQVFSRVRAGWWFEASTRTVHVRLSRLAPGASVRLRR